MGINGYQYINDSYHCMVCDDECTSSSCDGGARILPWVQDLDFDNDSGTTLIFQHVGTGVYSSPCSIGVSNLSIGVSNLT